MMAGDSGVVGKVADAVKETAKTTGKAVDAAAGIGAFLDRVFGDLVTDAVGLVGDRLKLYRLERFHLLADKTKRRLKEKGIDVSRPLHPKVALPLLECATLEEDDDLHTLWANLLTSGLDPNADPLERKFVSTLAEMTADDAYTLASMWHDWQKQSEGVCVSVWKGEGPGVQGTDCYDAVSVITLNRLGLIAPSFIEIKTYEPGGHDDRFGAFGPTRETVRIFGDLERVVVTPFGEHFCRAVGIDEKVKGDGQ
jgi:hypothetical protein